MTVKELISILQTIEDDELRIHTLSRIEDYERKEDTYRGISKVSKQKDILGNPRIVLSDG